MRIKIDFEVPQWFQWLLVGCVSAIVGAGAMTVYGETVVVKADWKKGDLLSAADLNQNFANLKAAVERLDNADPDCPRGYTRDVAESGVPYPVICKKQLAAETFDEVVKVSRGAGAYWMDRYEATIWSDAVASGTPLGQASSSDYPASFPGDGNYTKEHFAFSVRGRRPSAFMTWYQAALACRASGKRMPRREEWLVAAMGTPDPTAESNGSDGSCVTKSLAPRNTGGGTKCRSRLWGTEDMIGNMWEWTDEWYASPGSTLATKTWPNNFGNYGGDFTVNVASSAKFGDDTWYSGLPVAAARGGYYNNGTGDGVFALSLTEAPSNTWFGTGVRCVVRI
jgi:formylglycine-generating enzyme required for sulfatase activity